MTAAIDHCLAKISALAGHGTPDRRTILQLGYNLGRLSELVQLGRGPCWDRWKDAVDAWDPDQLPRLARELRDLVAEETPPATST